MVADFLELSKAFDCVSHKMFITKLKMLYNFSHSAIKLMKSYLPNRIQSVKYNQIFSDCEKINMGVPQGSVLDPIIYLLFTNVLNLNFPS